MTRKSKAASIAAYQITHTTDGKYIGSTVSETGKITTYEGVVEIFIDNMQIIGDGAVRISNSNYIIEARII